MKDAIKIAGLLAGTILCLALLLTARPFDHANVALDRAFGAAPEWAQVTNMVSDPATQEVTHGEHPLRSFRILESAWAGDGAPRVLFVGNSQMFTISLAPGEPPTTLPEQGWVDILNSRGIRGYRLSAPGMSYTEALWYLQFLSTHQTLRPNALVLQLNYQSFWNGGIRPGMLELLNDEAFRTRIQSEAASTAPYAEAFRSALNAWTQQLVTHPGAARPNRIPGTILEDKARVSLSGTLARAAGQKSALMDTLYRVRVYVFHLNPTTARSIAGTRLLQSQASIESIARLCREEDIKLVMYSAPVNPRVDLYRRPEDQQSYQAFLHLMEVKYQVRIYDLEHAIPEQYWGTWMNGPDPLHLGREGHVKLAARMGEVIHLELAGETARR